MELMADDQENRSVTNFAPNVRFDGLPGECYFLILFFLSESYHIWIKSTADPAWGAAFPLITYWLWRYNGDIGVVRKHYSGIRDWVDYLTDAASKTYFFLSQCWPDHPSIDVSY